MTTPSIKELINEHWNEVLAGDTTTLRLRLALHHPNATATDISDVIGSEQKNAATAEMFLDHFIERVLEDPTADVPETLRELKQAILDGHKDYLTGGLTAPDRPPH